MLGQLAAGQFAIEAALAELADADPATRIELRRQLTSIAGLCQQIGAAQGSALSALRAEAATLIGSTAAAVQDARANAAAGSSSAIGMAMYAKAAREQVDTVMAGMKDFDPYLQFASPNDEAEYRRREDERRAYIAAEQAKHTPQGDLNAGAGALGQLADAAAHGAGNSPEFQQRWNAASSAMEALRNQLVRDGRDVTEFDTRLREDLRAIMRSKGVSEAKIDALLEARRDNPIDAMKAFVAEQKDVISEKEIDDLSRKAATYRDDATEKPAITLSPDRASPMVAAMANLKSSGVVMSDHAPEQPAHGVNDSVSVAAPARLR